MPWTEHQESPEIAARFPDLHPALTRQAATSEAHRCLNCFDAPCMNACPTQIDVPGFIKKISTGNLRGSALTILDRNILGGSCSRVCPVEILCEGACVLHHSGERAIQIGRLQRYAMDTFQASGEALPHRRNQRQSQRIACIGAGPSSLAAAAELAQLGFQVTIFDKRRLPGGLNTHGVAQYKLTPGASLAEIAQIEKLGVSFELSTHIDSDASLMRLEEAFDAIFLGVGLGPMHALEVEGARHPHVVDALDFIERYKLGNAIRAHRSVVVVGAGNTAIDAAVAAKRLGAEDVCIVYRRTRKDISAFESEYRHALAQAVRFQWLTQPISVQTEGDRIVALECAKMTVRPSGELERMEGSEFSLACDLLIPAIGQAPLIDLVSTLRGVRIEAGRVWIDRSTGQTSNTKYFAGGDCVNGGREVVDAVADGRRAAIGIAAMFGVMHA